MTLLLRLTVPRRTAISLRRSISNQYWNDKSDENETKFGKILIANRGEIACRVIKTCRRLGIKTVAVHSDVDTFAVHTRMADERICIGPAPTSQSYLNMEALLDAVKQTGAEGVHPGYGFLSENTDFAEKLENIGVAFIGPGSRAIRAMGDKLESKRIAEKAGVNCIPGFDGVVNDVEHALELAKSITYPVMLKASAGGGGKGMRICWNEKDIAEGWRMSTEEAMSSFGDDRMLIEKFVSDPRHIEIQVLGDKHGNAIYLNERECSIQRRNQKVIEEAPSTFLDPETRSAMGAQAVQLAKEVDYHSAGTVEFLVDDKKNFYFLEMNTRLQVEHPITELITGVDLVHQMLRVAKGHKLLHKQNDISIRGWSLESRVYAEDPYKNFGMPSVGRLSAYQEPSGEGVRCDSGVTAGSHISLYYDAMICKLVTYGENRDEARHRMIKALDSYVIRGVLHNIPLLRDILTEEKFVKGDLTTDYLPQTYPNGFQGATLTATERRLSVALAAIIRQTRNFLLSSAASPQRQLVKGEVRLHVSDALTLSGEETVSSDVVLRELPGDKLEVTVDGSTLVFPNSPTPLAQKLINFTVDGEDVIAQVVSVAPSGEVQLLFRGTKFSYAVIPQRAGSFLPIMPVKPEVDTSRLTNAPMPGIIKSVSVSVGDLVGENQEVCVLEAMKMQNSLSSQRASKVIKVHVKQGDVVSEGQVLVEFE